MLKIKRVYDVLIKFLAFNLLGLSFWPFAAAAMVLIYLISERLFEILLFLWIVLVILSGIFVFITRKKVVLYKKFEERCKKLYEEKNVYNLCPQYIGWHEISHELDAYGRVSKKFYKGYDFFTECAYKEFNSWEFVFRLEFNEIKKRFIHKNGDLLSVKSYLLLRKETIKNNYPQVETHGGYTELLYIADDLIKQIDEMTI